MNAQILRLVNPMTHQRCDDLPSAISRQVWATMMIGITTVNIVLAAYAETLKAYGYGR